MHMPNIERQKKRLLNKTDFYIVDHLGSNYMSGLVRLVDFYNISTLFEVGGYLMLNFVWEHQVRFKLTTQ